MASKVRGFGRGRPKPEVAAEQVPDVAAVKQRFEPARVDGKMLDEAVEVTLEGADARHADAMRRLWAMDPDSVVAQAYFTDAVRAHSASAFAEMGRKSHVVREVLTQEESARVAEYAREYTIEFRNSVMNDHAFFSARRGLDHRLIADKYPPTKRYIDFGGSILHHVAMGHQSAIVVAPFDMDGKDPTRKTLTRMALGNTAVDTTASAVSRAMAASVLNGDGRYHVDQSVQNATVQASISMAVHVYDVPIQDWPYMMERCGVKVHEGCLHFVNDFFENDSGDFEFSGARYEIDRRADVLRMRVGRGSSAWYEHKWSDFMRYGANQILSTSNARYSYQIVERRQDTIFYRILRVDTMTGVDSDQCYALPGVPVVEVAGFEVFPDKKPAGWSSRRNLVRKHYQFPQALWERMLAYATAELDRGALSYDKMFNYYRTVVPKQSINSVHISGGQSVPVEEVPALVVMAGVVAYGDALLLQRTVRARTDLVQQRRRLEDESTLYKLFRVFVDGLVAIGKIPFSPFSGLPNLFTSAYMALMRDRLVTWQPAVTIRSLNAAVFTDLTTCAYTVRMPQSLELSRTVDEDDVYRMLDVARVDGETARDVLRVCGDSLERGTKYKLETVASASDTAVDSVVGDQNVKDPDGVSGGPGFSGDPMSSRGGPGEKGERSTSVGGPGVTRFYRGTHLVVRTVPPSRSETDLLAERRLAIQEAIVEVNAEYDAVSDACARICRDVLVNGKPNEHVMRRRKEELYNPDLWYVNSGVLVNSVLSPDVTNFTHSGVYVPLPERSGNCLHPVSEVEYQPDPKRASSSSSCAKIHYVLPINYTGYVLVVDQLKVFNGPEVAATLGQVLTMDPSILLFDLHVHQGPPGCGKTTTIVSDVRAGDVFLTPTRDSKSRLSERIQKKHGMSSRRAWEVCRTLDSLLVNFLKLPERARSGFERMVVDEHVIGRAGKWYAAAALLGVREMHGYGDNRQITHKPRVQVPRLYIEVVHDVLEEEFVSERNCAKILATYNPLCGNRLRCTSTHDGFVVRVRSFKDVQWEPDTRLVSMYQADKPEMNRVAAYVTPKPIVSTVHEAQGSDCDYIVIYNSETRKREPGDSFYLYSIPEYALVAFSRARKGVYYVKQSNEPDLMTQMIEWGNDVRRVNAAREMETQGENNLLGL